MMTSHVIREQEKHRIVRTITGQGSAGHPSLHDSAAKYLGLTITEQLTWDHHIHDVTAKVNRKVGALWRARRSLSQKARVQYLIIRCDARPIIMEVWPIARPSQLLL